MALEEDLSQQSTPREASNVRPFAAFGVKQCSKRVGPILDRELAWRIVGFAGTRRVPRDHGVVVCEPLELRSPGPRVEQESVQEDQNRSVTDALVRDEVAVDRDPPHTHTASYHRPIIPTIDRRSQLTTSGRGQATLSVAHGATAR